MSTIDPQQSPTPTATALPPSGPTSTQGMSAVFYLVPLAIIAGLLFICTAIRVIPWIEYKLGKPKVTTTAQVQINYEDCDSISIPGTPPSSLALRPSTVSLSVGGNIPLKEMQSSESMIYVLEGSVSQDNESLAVRPIRSRALITVGEPPNYDESVIGSPPSQPAQDLSNVR